MFKYAWERAYHPEKIEKVKESGRGWEGDNRSGVKP
jgi:hypothetical protein